MSQTESATSGAVVPDRPLPHPDVETAYLSPEAVLYDGRTQAVIHLNGSAAAVWMTMDGLLDLDGLTDELAAIFEVEAGTIRDDVRTALAGFAAQGLLADVSASP